MLHLGIVDNAILYNMTPKEYNIKIKGKMLQDVQKYEDLATQALFIAKAQNSRKRVGLKDIFDADKARKAILKPAKTAQKRDFTRLGKALSSINKKDESAGE